MKWQSSASWPFSALPPLGGVSGMWDAGPNQQVVLSLWLSLDTPVVRGQAQNGWLLAVGDCAGREWCVCRCVTPA